MAGSCAHAPAEACTKLKGARVVNKDPVLQMSGIHVLTAASAIDVQTKGRADFFLPTLLQAPHSPAKVTFRGFKWLVCVIFGLSVILFLLLGARY